MGDLALAEVKRRVGSRMCLIGTAQIGDLISGEPADVATRVQEALRDGAPGGGFILSTTASPYEEELSGNALANYRLFVKTGRQESASATYAPHQVSPGALGPAQAGVPGDLGRRIWNSPNEEVISRAGSIADPFPAGERNR